MTSESENDMSTRLINEVMRGRASRVDRTTWVNEGWAKGPASLVDFDDDPSRAAVRVRKADVVSAYQLGS